jgi:23S rRNA (guanosine2251-2'-O)-methyltransferase
MSNFKKYTQAKSSNGRRERGNRKPQRGFSAKSKTFTPRKTSSFIKKPSQNFETFTNSPRREYRKYIGENVKADDFIYGKNVLLEALTSKIEMIEKVVVAKDKFTDEKILNILNNQKTSRNNGKIIPVEYIDEESFPKAIKKENHQGIFAKANLNKITVNFKNFLENLEVNSKTCLIILGELEDVQNVGSIIRSASAFGISGVLIPQDRQAQVNDTVIKISAGQAFNIPLVSIGNVNDAIKNLKEKGFWIYGLDMNGEKFIHDEKFSEPTAFIIGNEGEGLRKSFIDNCDFTLKIPMNEKCESLNASISAATAMYEWRTQNL